MGRGKTDDYKQNRIERRECKKTPIDAKNANCSRKELMMVVKNRMLRIPNESIIKLQWNKKTVTSNLRLGKLAFN